MRWSAHAGTEAPYTIDPKFAERVDWAIDHALVNELNIIVNVHHYGGMASGAGAYEQRVQDLL